MNGAAPKLYKHLRDVLLDSGLIDQVKYDEINLQQLKSGQTEEQIIDQLRILSDVQLAQAKAQYIRVDYVDLDEIGFAPEALALVP